MTMILTLEEGIITLIALGLLFWAYQLSAEKKEALVRLIENIFMIFGLVLQAVFLGFLLMGLIGLPIIWMIGIILKIVLLIVGVRLSSSVIELGFVGFLLIALVRGGFISCQWALNKVFFGKLKKEQIVVQNKR